MDRGVTMRSGRTVLVGALSHQGFRDPDAHPNDYLGTIGVRPQEIPKDGIDFWDTVDDGGYVGNTYVCVLRSAA
jgi:hypothetical protein